MKKIFEYMLIFFFLIQKFPLKRKMICHWLVQTLTCLKFKLLKNSLISHIWLTEMLFWQFFIFFFVRVGCTTLSIYSSAIVDIDNMSLCRCSLINSQESCSVLPFIIWREKINGMTVYMESDVHERKEFKGFIFCLYRICTNDVLLSNMSINRTAYV